MYKLYELKVGKSSTTYIELLPGKFRESRDIREDGTWLWQELIDKEPEYLAELVELALEEIVTHVRAMKKKYNITATFKKIGEVA